jgi:hypothetical protein
MTPWRARVDVGSELANDTIPMLYFFVDAAVVCDELAAAADDVLLDEVLLDDALLLLEPQPAASTATAAVARAAPTLVHKCLLDTTFSSPALGWRSR